MLKTQTKQQAVLFNDDNMDFPDKESLKKRYEECDDQLLFHILKHRKDYQDQLVEVICDLLYSRGLEQQVDELLGGDSASQEKSFKLFPAIFDVAQRQKTMASLTRTIYLIGLYPLIQTALGAVSGELEKALFFGILTVLWFGLAITQHKRRLPAIAWGQIILLVITAVEMIMTSNPAQAAWTDWLIGAIAFFIIAYLTTYLRLLLIADSMDQQNG